MFLATFGKRCGGILPASEWHVPIVAKKLAVLAIAILSIHSHNRAIDSDALHNTIELSY